jgi:hypothetical protein
MTVTPGFPYDQRSAVLISSDEQFVQMHFTNEAELENVLRQLSDQLFGSSTLYLPQVSSATVGGRSTVPDASVIEVERAVHGT